MDQKLYTNHLEILKDELIMALGCTEPIAIAYAAAKARKTFQPTSPTKAPAQRCGSFWRCCWAWACSRSFPPAAGAVWANGRTH